MDDTAERKGSGQGDTPSESGVSAQSLTVSEDLKNNA